MITETYRGKECRMKQAKLLLLFVVVFAMLFAGCTNLSTTGSDRSQSPDPAASKAEEVLEPPKPTVFEVEKALVSVDYTADELLSEYESYTEFIEFEDEDYQKELLQL